MNKQQSIERLQVLSDTGNVLKQKKRFPPEFTTWKQDIETAIMRIFDSNIAENYVKKIYAVRFGLMAFTSSTPDGDFERAYRAGIGKTIAILDSCINEISIYWPDDISVTKTVDNLDIIENLSAKFHKFILQLSQRYADRKSIIINDEYDVQDVFHSLLVLHFDDIRPEEWTPSYAGKSSRMDFLLKAEDIIIEIKKTRKDHNAGKIGDELSIDIMHYKSHPNCKKLVCFVYDPDMKIKNPTGLIRDLEQHSTDQMQVKIFINPML